jgi:hypothetical protein
MSEPKKQNALQALQALLPLAVAGGMAWYFWGGGIEHKVADDMIADYNTAKATGDDIKLCVQAGMVVAAFIQANDAEKTREWSAVEKADCERAGVPK